MNEALNIPNPTTILGILAVVSLLPFFVVMVTSYMKLIVVMNLTRNALGVQQIPPNLVINGIAIILSVYIMGPVIQDSYQLFQERNISLEEKGLRDVIAEVSELSGPLKSFLIAHSSNTDRNFFVASTRTLWPENYADNIKDDDLLILIPSFIVNELTTAFEIGFLIYLPFIVVDLIVSNILLAMGMMMVSPMTIAIPFKLLLFVLVSGWTRLIQGLILTYK